MEYFRLLVGFGLTVTFIWLLFKNSKRINFINAILRFDTILGLVAGFYFVFSSAYSLLVQ
jgi:hypothetical protein